MKQPFVSIGVATIPGREKYLTLCLKSIINQKFHHDYEIILALHPDFHYNLPFDIPDNITIKTIESGKSISSKRNDILKLAKGKYLLSIDDDAIAENHWIAKMINTAETNNLDIFWGAIKPIYERELPSRLYPYEMLIGGFHFDHNGNLRRKSLIGCNYGFKVGLSHSRGRFAETLGRGTRIRGGEEDLFFSEYLGSRSMFIKDAIVFHHIQQERVNFKYIIYNQCSNVKSTIYINKEIGKSNLIFGVDLVKNYLKSLIKPNTSCFIVFLAFSKLLVFCKVIIEELFALNGNK